MESVTERMKDRRGQRLLDNVGGASEDRTEPGRHNYRPQHMLLFSSLAQALTFFVFIWFWARQQYPSTLIYETMSVCLGVMGVMVSCCCSARKVLFLYVMISCLLFGLLVDPLYLAVEECTFDGASDCAACSAQNPTSENPTCPYCCYTASSGSPCRCKVFNLAVYTSGFVLQVLGASSAISLLMYVQGSGDSGNPRVPSGVPPPGSHVYNRFESGTGDEGLGQEVDSQAADTEEERRGVEEMRRRLQHEARSAATRVFR